MVDLKREIETHSDIFLILLMYFGMRSAKDADMNGITQSGPGVGCDDRALCSIGASSFGPIRSGRDSVFKPGDLALRWRALIDLEGLPSGQEDEVSQARNGFGSDVRTDLPILNEDETTPSNLAGKLLVRCAPTLSDSKVRGLENLSSRQANGFVRPSRVMAAAVPDLGHIAEPTTSQTQRSLVKRLPRKVKPETESKQTLERRRGVSSSDGVSSLFPGAAYIQASWLPPLDRAQKREPKVVDQLMPTGVGVMIANSRAKIELSDPDEIRRLANCAMDPNNPSQDAPVLKEIDADPGAASIRADSASSSARDVVNRPPQQLSNLPHLDSDSRTASGSTPSDGERRNRGPLRIPKSYPQNSTRRADQATFSVSSTHRKQQPDSDCAATGVPGLASGQRHIPISSHGIGPSDSSTASAQLPSRTLERPGNLRNEAQYATATFAESPKLHWIHTGSHRAEAGFEDPSFGWIGVRAERDSGGLRAVLVPSSNDAEEALSAHLSGLNVHLASNHIQMLPVTVSSTHGGSFDSSFNSNAQHGNDRQRGHADGATPQECVVRGDSGADGPRDSEQNLTFFATGDRASSGSYVSLVA